MFQAFCPHLKRILRFQYLGSGWKDHISEKKSVVARLEEISDRPCDPCARNRGTEVVASHFCATQEILEGHYKPALAKSHTLQPTQPHKVQGVPLDQLFLPPAQALISHSKPLKLNLN